MYEQVEKPKENKSRSIANSVGQNKSNVKQGFGFVDNRPEAVAQRKLQEMVDNSSKTKSITQLQMIVDNRNSHDNPLQNRRNNTCLPDHSKRGMLNLSSVTQLVGEDIGAEKTGSGLLDATGLGLGMMGLKLYFAGSRSLIDTSLNNKNFMKPLYKFGGGVGAQQVGGHFSTLYSMWSLQDSFNGFMKATGGIKAVKAAPLILGAGLMAKKFYDSLPEHPKDDKKI
jgi:hypothetical protein